MSKFQVGDKVRVLPRKEGQREQAPWYTNNMVKFENQEFQVVGATEGSAIVRLGGEPISFAWHEDWLEHADGGKIGIKRLLRRV